MKSSPVRELARRYAAGELSLDEYRAQRRALIDGVTTGRESLEYLNNQALRTRHTRISWAFFVPVVVITIVIAISVLWEAVNKPRALHGHHSPAADVHAGAQQTGPVLIQKFLEANTWTDADIERFVRRWQTLPPHEQAEGHRSYLYPRLLAALHEQITSQQAMVSLGRHAGADTTHLSHLQQMATLLSEDQRH